MSEQNPQKKNLSTFHSTPKTVLNLSQVQQQSIHYLSNENKIYSKSSKAKKAISKYFDEVHRENLQNKIKRSILDKLDRENRQRQFQTKFSKSVPNKSFTSRKKSIQTTIQLEEKQRERFLSNYADVVNLELECRLREFHFAGQQKIKSKTQYLKRMPMTSRHRKITSTKLETSKLFGKHNEGVYKTRKNLQYIKHDKFIQKCCQMGKNSISYKRQRNFQVIQYIIKQGHKKLLQSREQQILSEQEQNKFNKVMRLYLQFADYSDAYRIFYEYVTEKQWQRLKKTICQACPNIKKKAVEQQIGDLIRYKTNNYLYFQDFNQLLQNLEQKHNCSLMDKIQQKFPQMFQLVQLNQHIQKLGPEVKKWMNKNKIDVAIKMMFNSVPEKLNMGKYLNIKTINEIFKKYQLVPKIFWQNKLLFYCMWIKRRRQGLSFEELIDVMVHIMLSRNGKPQHFYVGLKELNLGVKLLK